MDNIFNLCTVEISKYLLIKLFNLYVLNASESQIPSSFRTFLPFQLIIARLWYFHSY